MRLRRSWMLLLSGLGCCGFLFGWYSELRERAAMAALGTFGVTVAIPFHMAECFSSVVHDDGQRFRLYVDAGIIAALRAGDAFETVGVRHGRLLLGWGFVVEVHAGRVKRPLEGVPFAFRPVHQVGEESGEIGGFIGVRIGIEGLLATRDPLGHQ